MPVQHSARERPHAADDAERATAEEPMRPPDEAIEPPQVESEPSREALPNEPPTEVSRASDWLQSKPEPKPEPEPEPEPDMVRVVHTSEERGRDEQAVVESRFDQAAVETRRSPVTSPVEGQKMPWSPESAGLKRGPREPTNPGPVTAGPSASSVAGSAGAGGRVGVAGSSGADGVPVADNAPDWFQPIARRVRPQAAPTDPATPPDRTDAVVPVPRPATVVLPTVEPRTLSPVVVDEPVPPTTADAPASPVVDPLDAVAEAETPEGHPRPTLDTRAVPDSSQQTVVDGPLADLSTISTRGTERGAWIQRVNEVVNARWAAQVLPPHLVGMRVRGEVRVRFTIEPSGRTDDVEVVRRSGNEWLDALAVQAIPARVPRMPRRLASEAATHEITFRYR